MKNFLLLLRAITKNNDIDMPDKGENAKRYKRMGMIAVLCIMLPCCLIVGFIVYVMTQALMEAGGNTQGLSLVVQLMCVFGVVFSVMVIFNLLYFSSDLDHILPLPIKPAELVAAKFAHAYFAESVMEFLILFCGFIGYFIAAGIKPVSFITAITGVFLLPVLPLVYCGIFCLIVMAFFSKIRLLRNVDFMVGLFSVLFMGLFVISFMQMDSINIENYISGLMSGENVFIKIMEKIFFTVPVFLKAVEENSILYFLLFLLINIAAVAVLLFLGNKLYLRGVYLVSSLGHTGRKKDRPEAAGFQVTEVKKAYFLKECKILYRTPAYKKYCVMVNWIWPIVVIALFIMPSTREFMESFRKFFSKGYIVSDTVTLLFVIVLGFFATAMNSIASTAFTREGAHFSFIKHVPLEYRTQVNIKALTSILYSGITVFVSVLLFCIFMRTSILSGIFFEMIGMMSVVICTYIGIMLDATHPKLEWEDEYGALRGNLNAFFNMAIAIVIAMVLCFIGFVLFRFTPLSTGIIFFIYFTIFAVVTWRIKGVATVYAVKSISGL